MTFNFLEKCMIRLPTKNNVVSDINSIIALSGIFSGVIMLYLISAQNSINFYLSSGSKDFLVVIFLLSAIMIIAYTFFNSYIKNSPYVRSAGFGCIFVSLPPTLLLFSSYLNNNYKDIVIIMLIIFNIMVIVHQMYKQNTKTTALTTH